MNYTLFNIAKLPIVTSKLIKTIKDTKTIQQYIFAKNDLHGTFDVYYKASDFIPQPNRLFLNTYLKVYDTRNNIALYENCNYKLCLSGDIEHITYYINLLQNHQNFSDIYIKDNPISGKLIELKLKSFENVPDNFNDLCDESRKVIEDITKRI